MAAKYVEFDRKPNFIPKFPKIGLARWSRLSEHAHSQCGPLQRAIVAKWLKLCRMIQDISAHSRYEPDFSIFAPVVLCGRFEIYKSIQSLQFLSGWHEAWLDAGLPLVIKFLNVIKFEALS